MLTFINPKTDFAFKKIFGSPQSKDILISFLNSMLYGAEPIIQSLDILDPYQAPKIEGIKNSFLDIKALLANGKTVIIEMQVLNVLGFEKRMLYNAAKSYSTQLKPGDDYTLLNLFSFRRCAIRWCISFPTRKQQFFNPIRLV